MNRCNRAGTHSYFHIEILPLFVLYVPNHKNCNPRHNSWPQYIIRMLSVIYEGILCNNKVAHKNTGALKPRLLVLYSESYWISTKK